ncbi:MAG: ADP-ribosylglycohydrolase family protein [Candidatus Coprovivens sp.]
MGLRYLDGLMGFAVGDAMGVPLEFKKREELLAKPVTKMTGFGTHNVEEGTWSDDTSMLIATIDSINTKGLIDFNDIALKFTAFKNHANYTPNNEVFDIGNTCARAIDKYDEERKNPTECGLKDINSNGNGSLMRILPAAYYAIETKLQEQELLELVSNLSSITHGHEISIMGCYIYTRFIMFLLNGKDKYSAYSMTKCVDYSMFSEETRKVYDRILNDDINKYKLSEIKSSGYIVDTLEAVIWVILQSDSFKSSIIGAINLGDDTDTIGALTGAAAGIIYGYDYIPEEWINELARKDYLLDIFEEFSENTYE